MYQNNQRTLGKTIAVFGVAAVAIVVTLLVPEVRASSDGPGISPDEAIKALDEGNKRYADGESIHPNTDAARREETSEHGQHPFATVITCSDSRVPVELLFD